MRWDSDWARQRFVEARVARLATVSAEGAPHVVPIVYALVGGTLYSAVDAKPKRTTALARLANIAAEPRVSVLVDHYDDDWQRLWWARADGTARELDDAAEVAAAVASLTERYPQYHTARPAGPVLAVRIERWSGWSAGSATDDA